MLVLVLQSFPELHGFNSGLPNHHIVVGGAINATIRFGLGSGRPDVPSSRALTLQTYKRFIFANSAALSGCSKPVLTAGRGYMLSGHEADTALVSHRGFSDTGLFLA
jgi:hypothetical protein